MYKAVTGYALLFVSKILLLSILLYVLLCYQAEKFPFFHFFHFPVVSVLTRACTYNITGAKNEKKRTQCIQKHFILWTFYSTLFTSSKCKSRIDNRKHFHCSFSAFLVYYVIHTLQGIRNWSEMKVKLLYKQLLPFVNIHEWNIL